MSQIKELHPSLIWKYFDEILKIPRPSKKEEKIIDYIEDFAKTHKLPYKIDDSGNILIVKEATKGFERKTTTILQSHLDMVCEKDSNIHHNFETDPIPAYIDEGWIKSKGTTLGADNGIGIAAQLAILADNSIAHGPIECLFTVDEETGLTGAFKLENNFISGKILLNLDSEDEGEIFIGCAGGMDTVAKIPIRIIPVKTDSIALYISISGLTGGHSGDDINKGYANSIKILSRFLWNANNNFEIQISNIQGGNLRNAIPREANCAITFKIEDKEGITGFLTEFTKIIKKELEVSDPGFELQYSLMKVPEFALHLDDQKELINSLHACPNGVIKMSDEIPDLVETSTNLASVKIIDNQIILITTSQRSSVSSAKRNISDMIRAQFSLPGAEITQTDNYPGWTPNIHSEILKISRICYKNLFKKEPVVRAIHAGLECGLFLAKYPELDMISFGPTIKGAHSPAERMDINSVNKFWEFLIEILKQIPENKK